MQQEPSSEAEIEDCLRTLGIDLLCQWDVLVFLYRHQTTLVGAEYLSLLLGYATEPVVAALDVLEALGFVARSRVSQGARLYQFTVPPVTPRHEAFRRLAALSDHRTGRLLLSRKLRRENRIAQQGPGMARRCCEEAQEFVPATPQWHPHRDEGRETWLKVI